MDEERDMNKKDSGKPVRIERKLAWVLIIAGAAMILLYVLYALVRQFGNITLEKLGAFLLLTGFLVLVISVLVERLKERGSDKYRDVQK